MIFTPLKKEKGGHLSYTLLGSFHLKPFLLSYLLKAFFTLSRSTPIIFAILPYPNGWPSSPGVCHRGYQHSISSSVSLRREYAIEETSIHSPRLSAYA